MRTCLYFDYGLVAGYEWKTTGNEYNNGSSDKIRKQYSK